MQSLDTILKAIKMQCFINNGSAFDVNGLSLNLTYSWQKKYCGKKFFFSCHWVYEGVTGIEECHKMKKLLSKLPNGISFTSSDSITQKLPEKATQYHTIYEWHTTTFTIHVSNSYSQSIVNQNKGSKIVCIGNFDSSTMRSAVEFKKKVMTSHREILDPLLKNGFLESLSLTNNGFTDHNCHGYSLQAVNMKPLQNESQRLGLVLALGEYGEQYIPDNEICFIDNLSSDGINISRIQKKTINSNLNDW